MYYLLIAVLIQAVASSVRVNHGNPTAFEGDIGLDPETRAYVMGQLTPDQAYKGVFSNRYWPGAKVPYVFDRNFDSRRRQLMNQAFEAYNKHTCVRFVPRSNERNYVRMVDQSGCWSIIGRGGGQQLLKMGGWCLQLGTAMHELMHAIGFYHEQSRFDRDNFVEILWGNIQSGEKYNFEKYRSDYLGEKYDLNSIMHYRNTEFGSWGRVTIRSKNNHGLKLGNSYFSDSDIRAINKMYKCNGNGNGITPAPPPPSGCDNKDDKCNFWASNGYCAESNAKEQNYRDVMKNKCCKACKENANCRNLNNNCGQWASNGECDKNQGYMRENCRLACKLCS